jgi:hypothetical protein
MGDPVKSLIVVGGDFSPKGDSWNLKYVDSKISPEK